MAIPSGAGRRVYHPSEDGVHQLPTITGNERVIIIIIIIIIIMPLIQL